MKQKCKYDCSERGTKEQIKENNRSISLERTENKLLRNAGRTYRNFERSTEVSGRKIVGSNVA